MQALASKLPNRKLRSMRKSPWRDSQPGACARNPFASSRVSGGMPPRHGVQVFWASISLTGNLRTLVCGVLENRQRRAGMVRFTASRNTDTAVEACLRRAPPEAISRPSFCFDPSPQFLCRSGVHPTATNRDPSPSPEHWIPTLLLLAFAFRNACRNDAARPECLTRNARREGANRPIAMNAIPIHRSPAGEPSQTSVSPVIIAAEQRTIPIWKAAEAIS